MEKRLQRGLRLLERHARLHPAEHVDPPAAPVVDVVPVRRDLRFHHQRYANARGVADVEAVESRLRDADDRERIILQRDAAADDRRIGCETVLPVVVAENRDRAVATHLVVVRRDDAADRRSDPEHRKVSTGHHFARHALALPVDADVHRGGAAREQAREYLRRRRGVLDRLRNARERTTAGQIGEVVAEVLVHRERQHVAAGIAPEMIPRAVEQHELLGILDRQRPQQHFVDQRENGGIGADPQGDGQQRDEREQGRAAEAAPRVPEIPREMTHTPG
jgi:hypothetical protein